MFIKLCESALFLKYYNVKLHINTSILARLLSAWDYNAEIKTILSKLGINDTTKR